MNSKKKLSELFQYIRSVEEKAKDLYENYLARIKDPEIVKKIQSIRDEEAGHVGIAEELLRLLHKYETVESHMPGSSKQKIFSRWIYLLAGIFLGLGAPVGSLLLRFLQARGNDFSGWFHDEINLHRWFYLYMSFGTVLAFSLSGWFVGLIHERLKRRTVDLTVKARVLEDLSEKDALTGLYNFGYIRQRLNIEMERSKRFHTPLSCLMLDIDNLKAVNDRYGHTAGDLVIKEIAQCVQREVRVIDTATRYGGDEFLLILPVTSGSGAWVAATRISKKVKEIMIPWNGFSITPAISVGAGTFPSPYVEDVDSLIEAADKALYQAKHAGRGQTVSIAR